MTKNRQEVFEQLFDSFVECKVISVELQELAHLHGIPIEAVEDAALAYIDEDLEDE